MKKLTKEILLLLLYNCSNCMMSIWVIVFPYLFSYLIHYNPSLSLKEIFSSTIILFFGVVIGNFMLPRFYFFFGIKVTMKIGGYLNMINCLLFIYLKSIYTIYFNVMLLGLSYQFVILSTIYYLSQKFKDGHLNSSYCNIG